MTRRRILPIFIPNYGCEHDCVFCNQSRISGSLHTSPADVRAIINAAVLSGESGRTENDMNMSRPIELALYGGSFTALPLSVQNEYLESAKTLLTLNPQNTIRISTRPDCIDHETVSRLSDFGVKTIELGAQSMDDEVLRLTKRGHSPDDVRAAAKVIKAAGLTLILQMMTGLPGDTREKSLGTAEQIAKLKPDGVRIYPAVIVRGTAMYDMWLGGEYSEHTVDDAISLCAELVPVFDSAEIPIIRLGLNPTDDLSGGEAAAGAYHPALGELVYSRVCYNMAEELLEEISPGSDVILTVSKGFTSKMTGRKRENIIKLTDRFSLRSLKVVESDTKSKTSNLPIIHFFKHDQDKD